MSGHEEEGEIIVRWLAENVSEDLSWNNIVHAHTSAKKNLASLPLSQAKRTRTANIILSHK
jgi:hypothetical protein